MAVATAVQGPGNRGGWDPPGPQTIDIMIDKRYQPTLAENLLLGCAKAHRAVTYSHYDYRNYNRGSEIPRGTIK